MKFREISLRRYEYEADKCGTEILTTLSKKNENKNRNKMDISHFNPLSRTHH